MLNFFRIFKGKPMYQITIKSQKQVLLRIIKLFYGFPSHVSNKLERSTYGKFWSNPDQMKSGPSGSDFVTLSHSSLCSKPHTKLRCLGPNLYYWLCYWSRKSLHFSVPLLPCLSNQIADYFEGRRLEFAY